MYLLVLFIQFCYSAAKSPLVQNINIHNNNQVLLYPMCYAQACNEFARPISALLCPGNTAPFEKMSHRWRAIGNTSHLTCPRVEP